MERSLFNLGTKGTHRGRVNPTPYDPPHGEWVFCLGFQGRSDLVSVEHETELPTQVWDNPEYTSKSWTTDTFEVPYGLKVGDRQSVFQNIDMTGVNLVRVAFFMSLPTPAPSGLAWEVAILVDGVKKSRMKMTRNRSRTRYDMAANVSKIDGVRKVEFRLTLVEE